MKVAVLIDGGHLRVLAKRDGQNYNPDFIEQFAHLCVAEGEQLLRILYYDCAPYAGQAKLPVSGSVFQFTGDDSWLKDLAARDFLAVRRGVLKFRGFEPRRVPVSSAPLTDADFKPDFEQKGVDMRIGLDIATLSATRSAERIVLVTGDTDCIPAMKHARIAGLQIVLVELPKHRSAPELKWHSDLRRPVGWPQ